MRRHRHVLAIKLWNYEFQHEVWTSSNVEHHIEMHGRPVWFRFFFSSVICILERFRQYIAKETMDRRIEEAVMKLSIKNLKMSGMSKMMLCGQALVNLAEVSYFMQIGESIEEEAEEKLWRTICAVYTHTYESLVNFFFSNPQWLWSHVSS